MANSTKTIVLTGATRGLGRALTDRFVEQGHFVIGCGTSSDAVKGLQKEFGDRSSFTAVDVSRDAEVQRWAERELAGRGAPDLLINNAAIINANQPLWEVPATDIERIFAVNLTGVVNCIRHFVPAMIARGRGVIVNLSSGWGRSTSGDVASYCATKWGIEGLTQALAQELPKGLAAIPLNPGVINTEMLQICFGGSAEHYPTADTWSRKAAPFLLKLGPQHNGQSLSVD